MCGEFNLFSQTVYTFHTPGNWENQANWSPSYPGLNVSNAIININSNCVRAAGSSNNCLNFDNVTFNINNATFSHLHAILDCIWLLNSTINIDVNSQFISGSTLDHTNSTLNNYGILNCIGLTFLGHAIINNYGTINVTGATYFGEYNSVSSVYFNNYGITNVNNYLDFNCNTNILNDGEITINYSTFIKNYFIENNGIIKGNSFISGTCSTNCSFINSQTSSINPGNSPGKLEFNIPSDFPLPILNFEINGIVPATQYDQISVLENTDFTDATLNVTWGFTPVIGQVFDIITHGARTGQFSSVNIPPIPGLAFTVNYDNPQKTSIVVSPDIPLLITWASHPIAKIKNNKTHLNWVAGSQINSEKFVIEHSTDNKQFDEIGIVEGDGNLIVEKSYEYIHDHPSFGINIYRIKHLDFNGNSSYSNITSVFYDNDGREVNIWPNPARDVIKLLISFKTNLIITDIYGRNIQETRLIEGENSIDLKDLPAGLFIFALENGERYKILKE